MNESNFLIVSFFQLGRQPYFCRKYIKYGRTKEKYRFILVVISCFYSGIDICYLHPLALVDADSSFCNYFLCESNGYYVILLSASYKILPAAFASGFFI